MLLIQVKFYYYSHYNCCHYYLFITLFKIAIGVIILCLALFLFGAVQSGTPCGFMDIAPNFSSEMNTVAIVFLSCAGFLTPMLVSYYQRLYPTSLAWQYVFYITLLICGVAILVWKIFGKSEIIAELNTRI